MKEIENLNIAEEFDLRNDNNWNNRPTIGYYLDFNNLEESIKKHSEMYGPYEREAEKIKEEFEQSIIENYNASENVIETAYDLMDMSDNGYSYPEIEEYIVILLNCINKEK